MTEDRLITRRAFIAAAALGAGGLALAACSPAASLPPATTAAPSPSAPGATPGPTAAPTASALPTASPEPLRRRIARLLVVGFRGLAVAGDDLLSRLIADEGIGGVVLFDRDEELGARNVASPDQVSRLVADLRALAPDRELIVAIDQEGGLVTRLSPRYGFPTVASQAAIGEFAEDAVRAWAEGIATTLAGVGINLNLAPVVDLDVNPTNPAVGALNRAFSADASIVARDAGIEIAAHRARGVRTALKHFPGLGSATTNTDFGVADVTATWRDVELDPYRELLGRGLVDMVMAAHLVNGQLDPTAPASLSHATINDVLRGQLGWQGVVVTDDMGASAITETFGFEDAIELALNVGNDLLLYANQHEYDANLATRVIDVVEDLVGRGRVAETRIDEANARVRALFPAPG